MPHNFQNSNDMIRNAHTPGKGTRALSTSYMLKLTHYYLRNNYLITNYLLTYLPHDHKRTEGLTEGLKRVNIEYKTE